jgi:hypothetical protein
MRATVRGRAASPSSLAHPFDELGIGTAVPLLLDATGYEGDLVAAFRSFAFPVTADGKMQWAEPAGYIGGAGAG